MSTQRAIGHRQPRRRSDEDGEVPHEQAEPSHRRTFVAVGWDHVDDRLEPRRFRLDHGIDSFAVHLTTCLPTGR